MDNFSPQTSSSSPGMEGLHNIKAEYTSINASPTYCPFKRGEAPKPCVVCHEQASGMYFGALVCLPCKSFFIRSIRDGTPNFTCLVKNACDVTHGNRLRCQHCRFKKCLKMGMCRKEKPEIVQPTEGQVLCRVCQDIANGVHFGVATCEGCKKFFRRALKESDTYFCKYDKCCAMNPRNRNSCRYCRYQMCINVGMSRNAIRMGRPKKHCANDLKRSLKIVRYSKVVTPRVRNHVVDMPTHSSIDRFTIQSNLQAIKCVPASLQNHCHPETLPNHVHPQSPPVPAPLPPPPSHQGLQSLARLDDDDDESQVSRVVYPSDISVIQSCGNPSSIPLPQFEEIVTRGFNYFADSIKNQNGAVQTSLPSSDGYSEGTGSSSYSNSSHRSPFSGEGSPCADSTSFTSNDDNDDNENMAPDPDDFCDIISSLNQSSTPIPMSNTLDYENQNDDSVTSISDVYEVATHPANNIAFS